MVLCSEFRSLNHPMGKVDVPWSKATRILTPNLQRLPQGEIRGQATSFLLHQPIYWVRNQGLTRQKWQTAITWLACLLLGLLFPDALFPSSTSQPYWCFKSAEPRTVHARYHGVNSLKRHRRLFIAWAVNIAQSCFDMLSFCAETCWKSCPSNSWGSALLPSRKLTPRTFLHLAVLIVNGSCHQSSATLY